MAREIEALRRGLAVLDLLGQTGPLGLSEAARRAGLPKASALRVLATLAAAGHARQRLSDGRWEACARPARRAGAADGATSQLAQAAGPVLDRLCAEVLWPSDIGMFERGAIRVLETSRRRSPFVINRDVMGTRIHVMFSAMGRAILAGQDDAGRARMIAALRREGDARDRAACTEAAVARIVAETRARGHAVREPGYFVTAPGEGRVSAVALPVMAGGAPVAAVNLCWLSGAIGAGPGGAGAIGVGPGAGPGGAGSGGDTVLLRLRRAAEEIAAALAEGDPGAPGDAPSPSR